VVIICNILRASSCNFRIIITNHCWELEEIQNHVEGNADEEGKERVERVQHGEHIEDDEAKNVRAPKMKKPKSVRTTRMTRAKITKAWEDISKSSMMRQGASSTFHRNLPAGSKLNLPLTLHWNRDRAAA
jgi:hypothetical protein